MDVLHDHQHATPNKDSDLIQGGYELSGKVMLTSAITLFIIVLFIVMFHLYTRWFLIRHRRRLFHRRAAAIHRLSLSSSATRRGLDPAILASLPTFVYTTPNPVQPGSTPVECAVCLSEFEDGETGRVLPKCAHSFHVECIDPWFKTRSTCPLCRSIVRRVEPVPVDPNEPGPSAPGHLNILPVIECPRKSLDLERVVVEMVGGSNSSSRVNNINGDDSEGLSIKRFGSI